MPAHVPSDGTRSQVEFGAAFAIKHEDIAAFLRIDAKTLRKHYRAELDMGRTRFELLVGQSLAMHLQGRAAVYDAKGKLVREELPADRSVAIFLGKSILGLRERTVVETPPPYDLAKLNDGELDEFERLASKAKIEADPAGAIAGRNRG